MAALDPESFEQTPAALRPAQRWLVLAVAFAGWMFAGLEISLFVLIARPAVIDMLAGQYPSDRIEQIATQWFAWYQCAFLLGAAAGGWLLGAMGDRRGRARAMAVSVLCYSVVTGISYFVTDPTLLLVLRFIASLGIGGAWPNAVSLSVEALPDVSKPLLAGLMGAAANVGFVLLGVICYFVPVTPESWRWVLLVGASPVFLGLFIWVFVPESPQWLARRAVATATGTTAQPVRTILRPPLLSRTIIGICLGAIPVIGTAANANWLIPWADKAAAQAKQDDPALKALTQINRSGGAVFGSLLGGWLASLMGRRLTYFLISFATFLVSSYIYHFLTPHDPSFRYFSFLLGFIGVTYFGWLPLYLPELFPTAVRATGTGVTFNSGRILAAVSALGAGALARTFDGDYARIGTFTGLIYVVGMVVICFAPDTTRQPAEE